MLPSELQHTLLLIMFCHSCEAKTLKNNNMVDYFCLLVASH